MLTATISADEEKVNVRINNPAEETLKEVSFPLASEMIELQNTINMFMPNIEELAFLKDDGSSVDKGASLRDCSRLTCRCSDSKVGASAPAAAAMQGLPSAAEGYGNNGAGHNVPTMPSPPPPPPAAPADEEWLLKMAEEVRDGYIEGRSFELGRQDRIVCGVVTPEGRHTRYLMLHPFLLLLVQPDLQTPGLAVVRTLCPVRQVDPKIDRSDPRTLRLEIRMSKDAQCPGEAMTYDPSRTDGARTSPEDHKGSSFFMLTLSFEDVKRCLCADQHLRRRRQEVRGEIKNRVEAFIDRLSS